MDIQTLPLGAFQLAVMIGAEVTYHPFFKLRVMKYWSSIWLTDGRLPEPATDQTLFTRLTIVHLPGCTNTTADGPILNLPCPEDVVSGCRNRERWADTPH